MNGRRSSCSGLVEAPELEHLGVDLCTPLVFRVEPEKTLVGVVGEGLQRAVGRDKSSRLGSGFRVRGAGFRVQGSGCKIQGSWFRVQSRARRAMPPEFSLRN